MSPLSSWVRIPQAYSNVYKNHWNCDSKFIILYCKSKRLLDFFQMRVLIFGYLGATVNGKLLKMFLSCRFTCSFIWFIKLSSTKIQQHGVNGFPGILAQSHAAQDLEQDFEPVWEAWIQMHVRNKVAIHSNLNGVMTVHARRGEIGPDGVAVLKIVVAVWDLDHDVVSNQLVTNCINDHIVNVPVQILMKSCVIKHHANEK